MIGGSLLFTILTRPDSLHLSVQFAWGKQLRCRESLDEISWGGVGVGGVTVAANFVSSKSLIFVVQYAEYFDKRYFLSRLRKIFSDEKAA